MGKWFYYIIALVPMAFFFHLYEYGQHLKREEAPLLIPMMIVYIIISGWLSRYVKALTIIFFQLLSLGLSLICGVFWIEDDGTWFIPFGLNVAIIFVWVVVVMFQWFVRLFVKIPKDRDNKQSDEKDK